MSYEYYCTYCGKKLDQMNVLFDMQCLITEKTEERFQIIKFRMTENELKHLIASGTASDSGYSTVSLSFGDFMRYVSNTNNLNKEAVAALTIEEMQAYLNEDSGIREKQKEKPLAKHSSFAVEDLDDAINDDKHTEENIEVREVTVEEHTVPSSIIALEKSDLTITDIIVAKSHVKNDLARLYTCFSQNRMYTFDIRAVNEKDNEKNDVLTGYVVRRKIGGVISLTDARICCKCGEKVIPHAGTAKHQAVTFIGGQGAGKTSLILALTHYALKSMGGREDLIWNGKSRINGAGAPDALGMSARLQDDLDNQYSKGFAPKKTDAVQRSDAYSSTFRILNRSQNKYYILTLQDLPGELCVTPRNDKAPRDMWGHIDRNNIAVNFPIAMSCDAFIACFDTTEVERNIADDKVKNVVNWTDEFQNLRMENNQVTTYVPTMIVWTKCSDLEEGSIYSDNIQRVPLEQIYMLKDEKSQMAENVLYNRVVDEFNQKLNLQKAYHAMMRCSPYGFKAEKRETDTKDANTRRPEPKNIELLMKWILSVTGCIPTQAEYVISPNSPPFVLNNYSISRPQIRSDNPLKGYEVEESMARCALFDNPGKFDRAFVGRQGAKSRLLPVCVKACISPNSNAGE